MMNHWIGMSSNLDAATRLLAKQMMEEAERAGGMLESYRAYQKAKRKEADWRGGLFRAGLGLLLVVAALIDDRIIVAVPLGLMGGWLTMGGGLATSTEYNETMKDHGPALARFIATVIGAFHPPRSKP